MFLRDSVWRTIAPLFSVDEVNSINSVVKGRIMYPPGAEIDLDRLDAGLADKLIEALQTLSRGAGA